MEPDFEHTCLGIFANRWLAQRRFLGWLVTVCQAASGQCRDGEQPGCQSRRDSSTRCQGQCTGNAHLHSGGNTSWMTRTESSATSQTTSGTLPPSSSLKPPPPLKILVPSCATGSPPGLRTVNLRFALTSAVSPRGSPVQQDRNRPTCQLRCHRSPRRIPARRRSPTPRTRPLATSACASPLDQEKVPLNLQPEPWRRPTVTTFSPA